MERGVRAPGCPAQSMCFSLPAMSPGTAASRAARNESRSFGSSEGRRIDHVMLTQEARTSGRRSQAKDRSLTLHTRERAEPAINGNDGARHESRGVRYEPERRAHDLFRLAQPPQGHMLQDLVGSLRGGARFFVHQEKPVL